MWAILTHADKAGGGWTAEEFFENGRKEIARAMARTERLGLPARRGHALDFGCGIGRLSQALGEYFERVTGVDISPTMLELAREHNRHGDRCQYVLNAEPSLRMLADGSVDLIYSNITLQHIRPADTRRYLREFLRVLAPDGLLVFQLPGQPVPAKASLFGKLCAQLFRRFLLSGTADPQAPMYMNGMDRRKTVALLTENGGRVLEMESNTNAGPGFASYLYTVTRA